MPTVLQHVTYNQPCLSQESFPYQTSRADLPGAVAALAGQVLTVSQEAWGPRALKREPGVDESGGTAVVVHEERLRVHRTETCHVEQIRSKNTGSQPFLRRGPV